MGKVFLYIGFFCEDIWPLCGYIGLFGRYIGLYCGLGYRMAKMHRMP